MEYSAQRDAAVTAARAAARIIRYNVGTIGADKVDKKGKNDLVTVVDTQAQNIVIESLRDAFPGYGILAEEDRARKGSVDIDGSHRWIIDPIDGTTNFAHSLPPYAVSIALEHRTTGEVVVGVVLDVSRRELFTAIRGNGCYVNGVRCHVSSESLLSESLLTTGFPFKEFGQVDEYLETFKKFLHDARGVRRPGSASIDLAYVACGRFEGFFEFGLSPWDVAAGALLVEEAGGRVTDFQGGQDNLFNGRICASNGRVHESMLARLELLREEPRSEQ
jgi:myo-inositol-1(or 4)-monophosphatase